MASPPPATTTRGSEATTAKAFDGPVSETEVIENDPIEGHFSISWQVSMLVDVYAKEEKEKGDT